MISRLTAFAATFAILATATLAVAASAREAAPATPTIAKQVRVIQLDTVVITGKRLPQAAR